MCSLLRQTNVPELLRYVFYLYAKPPEEDSDWMENANILQNEMQIYQ